MAVALDKEELEHYNFAALTHGKEATKKWKWSSPDKAGTTPLPDHLTRDYTLVAEEMIKGYMGEIDNDERLRRARESAAALGRPIGYLTPSGSLIDADGKAIERTPDMLIARISSG